MGLTLGLSSLGFRDSRLVVLGCFRTGVGFWVWKLRVQGFNEGLGLGPGSLNA